jgi:hypothetical protein
MRTMSLRLIMAALFLLPAHAAFAQTADEVIDKSVAALGGRAAHLKLKSRTTNGTITLSTPAGDIAGSIEVFNAAPNKVRTVIKADLTALGAGPLVIDQRFDGYAGYVMDSLQGNRDMTGSQLDNLKNNSFPHPFLNYKDLGISAKVSGKERVGDRDAFVVLFDPTEGSVVKQFIDAETYIPLKMVMTVEVPQLGRDLEQTTEYLDYRDVDGVKLPFRLRATSSVQNFTIIVTKVEHNVAIDASLFVKPAGR